MNHRHLLPEEIDLLLDDEEGFGVAPLRTHLEQCPDCQARYNALDSVVGRLEALPLLVPAPRFADRVMTQVQVFEPWHVAARDSIQRLIPQSSFGKALVGATGGVMAVTMSLLAVWIGRRADAILFLTNLVVERTRDGLAGMAIETARALFGAPAASAIQNGGTVAVLGAAGALALTVGAVAFGVKAVATAGRRRRA
jgi:hypothetical protein